MPRQIVFGIPCNDKHKGRAVLPRFHSAPRRIGIRRIASFASLISLRKCEEHSVSVRICQQDFRRLGGGQRERTQFLGLKVMQIRLAGAALHHGGLAAARLQDVDHGATPLPRDGAVPELFTTSAMWGLADASGRPVVGPFVTQAV